MQHISFGSRNFQVHRHYHTRSCRKQKNSHSRYNFPVLPMRATRIIEPLSLEDNVFVDKSKSLFTFLEQREFDELMSFDDFLTELNLTEDEYIQAIQCTLKNQQFSLNKNFPIYGTTVSPRTCQLCGMQIQMRSTSSMHMLQHRIVPRI